MYLAPYNVAQIPTRYRPLWLRTENINAICNFIFQLKVDYAIRQLTAIPVPIEMVDFTWEQLVGSPPLEFSDYHVAQPIITLNPNVKEDLKFRVYMDKGKKTEMSADLWIYRTPTDFLETSFERDKVNYLNGLRVKGTNYNNASVNLNQYLPTDTNIDFAYLDSTNKINYNYNNDNINRYAVKFSFDYDLLSRQGTLINSIEIYDSASDLLVARTLSDVALIPLEVRNYYYVIVVDAFITHPKINNKRYRVYSNKVFPTLYTDYTQRNLVLLGFSDDFNGHTPIHSYIKKSVGSVLNIVSIYPAQLRFLDRLANTNISTSSKSVLTSQEYSVILLDVYNVNAINEVKGSAVTATIHNIERFSGITIGG